MKHDQEQTRWRQLALAGWVLVLAAAWPLSPRAQTVDEFGTSALKGAGSTFAHPLLSAWAREFRSVRTGDVAVAMAGRGLDDDIGGVALDYEAVGSQAGIQRVKAGAVDFAVSEMPLPVADLQRGRLLQVPLVAGAVAVVVNVEPVHGRELRLTPAVLADIHLGRIKAWNDAAIARLNPDVPLPALPIAVVHRNDGSGTTYTYTRFLTEASADWKVQVGTDLQVRWPVGTAYRGSAGIAQAVARTPGAIGYLDLVQARQSKLQLVSVQNPAGRFVPPSQAAVQAAAAAAEWSPVLQFNTTLVNRAGESSYPIVAAVYGLAGDLRSGARAKTAHAFFDWSLTRSRAAAEKLGYVALPNAVVAQVRAVLK